MSALTKGKRPIPWEPVGDRPTKMTKRIAGQIQGGGMSQIAALFGHSDNAGDAQRDRVSFAGLSPTGSWEPVGDGPTRMAKCIVGRIQGGGLRPAAALLRQFDNDEDAH